VVRELPSLNHMRNQSGPIASSALIEQYREAFYRYGDSPAAVLWPRDRQNLRFDALTRHIHGDGFLLLDYGCGLAHLKAHLDKRFSNYAYYGADVVPEFVGEVSRKYPSAQVRLIRSHEDVTDSVDHVVVSGTFNIVEGNSASSYLKYVQNALTHLFSLSQVSLAVNFMTDQVDFKQDNAHHVSVEQMYRFVRDKLTPRLIVDQSYMPYEFTIVAFRDHTIVRPDNIYKPL
jgi:cyclopropane fatty-acyl-phospholipid synthase-like methyltransferase